VKSRREKGWEACEEGGRLPRGGNPPKKSKIEMAGGMQRQVCVCVCE